MTAAPSTTGTRAPGRPDADLLDPGFYGGDPHAAYTWMRANEPVYRDEANALWAVTRHRDIQDVEARNREFVSGRGYRSFESPGETNMIAQDDPRHAEQRKLVARRFTPKAVRGHEDWIRATVIELIDAFADRGSVEVIDGLAGQLPTRLTARLLGWPEDRWPDVKGWAERLMQYDRILVDPEATTGMMTAIMQFAGDLQPMIDERRGCPMDDLVSVWTNAEIDGEGLDFETIMHETGLFISGGAETTRTVISRGLRAFCDDPDQWDLLHRHPEHLPTAVDEMVRWVTPLHNFFRVADTDTQIAGQPVSEGDRVILLYASGNRDESVFADPFAFEVTRTPNPHVGFGFGTHFCLGASLARFLLTVLLEEMTARITDLTVIDEIEATPSIFAPMVHSFTLGFSPR
jgi:cytochrome P450 family 142 subfamily A polypeptide 1